MKIPHNKKGLSNMIAYVILIAITLSLSVLVYNWLRFYTDTEDLPTCGDGVNIIITSYVCNPGDQMQVTLKNKGRFTVDGFKIRIHNRTNPEFGFYTLNQTGTPIGPGDEHKTTVSLTNFNKVTLLEVQPYITKEGKISCESLARQELSC